MQALPTLTLCSKAAVQDNFMATCQGPLLQLHDLCSREVVASRQVEEGLLEMEFSRDAGLVSLAYRRRLVVLGVPGLETVCCFEDSIEEVAWLPSHRHLLVFS
jgi:hypothetical protein